MLQLWRYIFFNTGLSTADVGTDMLTAIELFPDHPLWASLTLFWMFCPFIVSTVFFVIDKMTGKKKRSDTWTALAVEFYFSAGIMLPFVASLHHLWNARRLYQLRFGTEDFKMKNHAEVERYLEEATRSSYYESSYEAGPQAELHNFRYFTQTDFSSILPKGIISVVFVRNAFYKLAIIYLLTCVPSLKFSPKPATVFTHMSATLCNSASRP